MFIWERPRKKRLATAGRSQFRTAGSEKPLTAVRLLVVVAFLRRLDRLGAAVPLGVVLRDYGPGRLEGVAAVELERALLGRLDALPRERLERRGRERAGQLRDVRAAAHVAEELLQALLVAGTDREADQLAIV